MESNDMKVENHCCCCGGRYGIISIGIVIIIIGLAIKYGIDFAGLLLLLGAIFVVKGLLFAVFKK